MGEPEIDLETFIDLFDTALASDNPAVKNALKKLLLIATIVDSEIDPKTKIAGPLRKCINEINDLRNRLKSLENKLSQPSSRERDEMKNLIQELERMKINQYQKFTKARWDVSGFDNGKEFL